MKRTTTRITGFLAALAACFALAGSAPAQAAQAAPPASGLGALLGALLDPLRGTTPPPPPPAATAATPPPAVVSQVQAPPPPPPAATTAAPAGDTSALAVEQHLAALRYDVGPIDGNIDDITASAIMAFQKVHGLDRTGELSPSVAEAILAETGVPAPLVPNGDTNKVEIDKTRQVLFLYEGGQLSKILPISSGTAQTPTPNGSFKVYSKSVGWETSYLGRLYNSQYFIGGYAIHGSLSVPNYPASHGCVRIPMNAAEWFPDHVSIGTPVYILGS